MLEGVVLRPAPYDPKHPDAEAPERLRKDPRLPEQRLTAFNVELAGAVVGRVVMVEFEDRRGWFYAGETVDRDKPRNKPARLAVYAGRRQAVLAVLATVEGREVPEGIDTRPKAKAAKAPAAKKAASPKAGAEQPATAEPAPADEPSGDEGEGEGDKEAQAS
jgi:hypothetical protein